MASFLKRFQFVSLAALLLFSSLVGSLTPFFTNSASASSAYDNTLQTTDDLVLKKDGADAGIDVSDIWEGQVFAAGCTDFVAAMASGLVTITQYETKGTSLSDIGIANAYTAVVVTYYATGTQTLTFSGTVNKYLALGVPSSGINRQAVLSQKTSSPGTITTQCMTGSYSIQSTDPANTNTYTSKLYYSTVPVVYPVDYDGADAPTSPPLPPKNPPISYSVFRNVFTATYTGDGCIRSDLNPDSCPIPRLVWGVQQSTGDIAFSTLLVGQTFTFTATEYDHYNFYIDYTDSGVPYAPLSTEFDYQPTVIQVYIDGTNDYSSDTSMCTLNGDGFLVCSEVSPYEDCSTYGTDLIGGFACALRNLTVAWQSMLTRLFVPIPTYFNSYFDQFSEYMNSKLGFIYSSIASVFGILGGVIIGASTPNCTVSPPGTLFGASVEFDVCSFETVIGSTPFDAIQGLVIGITVVTLVFAGIRKYQSVVSHR